MQTRAMRRDEEIENKENASAGARAREVNGRVNARKKARTAASREGADGSAYSAAMVVVAGMGEAGC